MMEADGIKLPETEYLPGLYQYEVVISSSKTLKRGAQSEMTRIPKFNLQIPNNLQISIFNNQT